ncbi:uncharacterized protein LOC113793324 isoform X2 [Dermatophagoides pteronyssinus]
MATGGFYFTSLTRWLWPSPIYDYGDYDWRKVPESIGAVCFILFSIGLLIVLRSHEHELFVFALILLIPMVTISIMLIIHLIEKRAYIDLSDFFLLVIVILLISIIGHLFLYIQSLKNLQTNINRKHNPLQSQQQQQQQPKKTSIYLPKRETDTFEL